MFVRANFADICLQGIRDRIMRSGTELAREIQLTDWWTAGNLSNRSSGVQIPRDICTRFGRYLYSTKCSWIINADPSQVVSKYFMPCKWRTGHQTTYFVCLPASNNLNVSMVFQVLHRFANSSVCKSYSRNRFFLSSIFTYLSGCVVPSIVLVRTLSLCVHFFQTHPMFEIKLQVSVVGHVIFYVLQRQHHLLWRKRTAVVLFVLLFRVL